MEVAIRPIDSHAVLKKEMHNDVGFVHEPSPSKFARIPPDSLVRFWQFARINISDLPTLVESAINRGIQTLDSVIPPFMWISQAGHDNAGVVFYIRDLHNQDLNNSSNKYIFGRDRGLVARISFGPESKVGKNGWKLSDFERLHIGAYAFRDFLPIGNDIEICRNECLCEEIYLPLRWLKDEEGKWQFNDPYTEGCMNQETRTPWKRLTKGQSNLSPTNPAKRRNFIPFSQNLNMFGQEERKSRSIEEYFKVSETSHSGYGTILETLSSFGDVSPEDKVTEMVPEQGVEYLFGKVIPSMQKFVNA